MVAHCLQDDFRLFLDKGQYYLNGTVFDAIGLKPGCAPRERKLIGHSTYSAMTAGVGRGTIFNHRDPLHSDADYGYVQRCVERFRCTLASTDRKLFVVLNLNRQLWVEADLMQLFQELAQRTSNFLLLVVDCSSKNLGPRAAQLPEDCAPKQPPQHQAARDRKRNFLERGTAVIPHLSRSCVASTKQKDVTSLCTGSSASATTPAPISGRTGMRNASAAFCWMRTASTWRRILSLCSRRPPAQYSPMAILPRRRPPLTRRAPNPHVGGGRVTARSWNKSQRSKPVPKNRQHVAGQEARRDFGHQSRDPEIATQHIVPCSTDRWAKSASCTVKEVLLAMLLLVFRDAWQFAEDTSDVRGVASTVMPP